MHKGEQPIRSQVSASWPNSWQWLQLNKFPPQLSEAGKASKKLGQAASSLEAKQQQLGGLCPDSPDFTRDVILGKRD